MHEEYHQLAQYYFQGHITDNDEQRLFLWLNNQPQHLLLFRQWEQEWAENHEIDPATISAWQEVSTRTLEPLYREKKHRRFRRLVAAAAVLALLSLGGVSAWLIGTNPSEQMFTVASPMGSKSRIVLPDSSVVWLNAGSTLSYGSKFNERNRNVTLSGQGYFEVRHKADNREFTVHTNGYDVVVKGTRFTVTAYESDPTVTTSLLQGSVRIDIKNNGLMMVPGETVTLDRSTGKLTKVSNEARNVWMGTSADYGDITLEAFAAIMERQYDVDIDIRSPRLRKTVLSISINNDMKLPDLLVALKKVTQMKVERHGRKVTISE